MKSINFYNSDINFILRNKNKIRNWIAQAIINEKKQLTQIDYIFCDDNFILKLNKKTLNHNYYTDIITFQYNTKKEPISAEIYISIDTVKTNAKKFSQTFYNELLRVIIHGVLHCCDYSDKTEFEQKKMRDKEDFYVNKFEQ